MPSFRISLLGSLTATLDNQPISFRTDAQRALLAYLAAYQGMPQRRDTLAGLLSPDRNDKDALTYLRNRLTRLRAALSDDAATPPWFIIDRKQIALRTGDDIIIDVTEFEQRLDAVEKHAHRQLAGCPNCLARLEEAVNLVRGEFLAGLNFSSDTWEAWLLSQREHLQQRSMDAMTWLRDAHMVHNQWDKVLALAQRQLILEPWHEAAYRAIMQAHYQLGDRNAAIVQYEVCIQLLGDELGVEPEEETTALFEQIQTTGRSPDSGVQSPQSKVQSPESAVQSPEPKVTGSLPLQTNRFFGREVEQTHLIQRLVDPQYRLVTLVGAGGIGKTRLAIEVAQQVKTSFPDGVWFVPLDAVKGGAEQLKIAVGEVLKSGSETLVHDDNQLTGDQVGAILRDKQMLLIFDNCETVIDDLGFIPSWLNRAGDVVILATSREPLNFQAESVVLLEGLSVWDPPSNNSSLPQMLGELEGAKGRGLELGPAEAMFAEQARMARCDFGVTNENLDQVRQICQLVDGLPLGIALAAAWVRRRSLAQIIDSIEQSLDFLSTRMRDVDPRHRSMKAVFEASWQMLDVEEQALLAALSIFPASFTAQAAQQIAGAQVFDLDLLCEKSLLQQQHESERYQMHSLVRQFATQKLRNRKQNVEEAFVEYFFAYAQSSQDDYAQLAPEWNNFSAAVAKAHGLEAWQTVLDFVEALYDPWFQQARLSEMQSGLLAALETAKALANDDAQAKTLLRLGELAVTQNSYEMAEAYLSDSVERYMRLEDSFGIAHGYYFLGRIKAEKAQDEEALQLLAKSKRIFEDEADRLGVARSLNLMAYCDIKQQPESKTATDYLEESLSLQQDLPPSQTYVEALLYLTRLKCSAGEYAAAESYLAQAAHASQVQNDNGSYLAVLFERMVLSRRRNQLDEALRCGYECLELVQQIGLLRWQGLIKTQLGMVYQADQKPDEAIFSFHGSLQIFIELEDLFEQAFAHYYLYKLYAEIGNTELSIESKEKALHLNLGLKNAWLTDGLK